MSKNYKILDSMFLDKNKEIVTLNEFGEMINPIIVQLYYSKCRNWVVGYELINQTDFGGNAKLAFKSMVLSVPKKLSDEKYQKGLKFFDSISSIILTDMVKGWQEEALKAYP